jgi:hypothetical protein
MISQRFTRAVRFANAGAAGISEKDKTAWASKS